MSLDYLEKFDIDTLVELLLRSQQSRERKALCINIGIDHKRLNFIENTSDQDFFIRLVHYLNETGNNDALCKLCCKELLPTFRDQENRHILEEIIGRLGCCNHNQSIITQEPIPIFKKTGFSLIICTIFVIVLTAIGFPIYKQISNNNPSSNCANVNYNSSQKLSSTEIQILNLPNETCVEELLTIQGKVTVQDANQVWIVVKPSGNFPYYVQKPADINNGNFQALVYVGNKDTTAGTQFQIRAFVKPNNQLREAQELDNWPEAKWHSDIILVKRNYPK